MDSKQLHSHLKTGARLLTDPFVKDEDTIKALLKYDQNLVDFGSEIITQKPDQTAFIELIGRENNHGMELLYRGSKDGFDASKFHSLCDNQGATITFAKSQQGNIFGGYTDIAFVHAGYKAGSGNSFLFKLTETGKYQKLKCIKKDKEVYHHSDHLPTFGDGHDLFFANNCNQNTSSYSNPGSSYQAPPGTTHNSEEGNAYLTGSNYNFQVVEIEVFKLNTPF